jgi:hypothetical protein
VEQFLHFPIRLHGVDRKVAFFLPSNYLILKKICFSLGFGNQSLEGYIIQGTMLSNPVIVTNVTCKNQLKCVTMVTLS